MAPAGVKTRFRRLHRYRGQLKANGASSRHQWHFFRARDPERLIAWYGEKLGIATMDQAGTGGVWQQQAGPTVFAPFVEDTDQFGRPERAFMLNFRVTDLDAMLVQLRAAGVAVDDTVELLEGIRLYDTAYGANSRTSPRLVEESERHELAVIAIDAAECDQQVPVSDIDDHVAQVFAEHTQVGIGGDCLLRQIKRQASRGV